MNSYRNTKRIISDKINLLLEIIAQIIIDTGIIFLWAPFQRLQELLIKILPLSGTGLLFYKIFEIVFNLFIILSVILFNLNILIKGIKKILKYQKLE